MQILISNFSHHNSILSPNTSSSFASPEIKVSVCKIISSKNFKTVMLFFNRSRNSNGCLFFDVSALFLFKKTNGQAVCLAITDYTLLDFDDFFSNEAEK